MSHSSRTAIHPLRRCLLLAALGLLGLFAWPASLGCGADADTSTPTNQGFNRWCGTTPCDWKLDQGSVTRVGTWHPEDYAVSFHGPGNTQISQSAGIANASCLHFDVIAKAGRDASLTLRLDFNDDGKIDWSQSLSDDWRNVPFTIPTPTVYDGVRYILLKEGDGTALVAHLVVEETDDCPNFPLRLQTGSRCEDDSVCESGRCLSDRCQAEEATSQPTESE
jgi:hypothetical protein